MRNSARVEEGVGWVKRMRSGRKRVGDFGKRFNSGGRLRGEEWSRERRGGNKLRVYV